ncbi:hypothetical protein FGO68_gene5195 [Halteria grandinella]|uniref:Uncharacterized protein n=1 Tax=Halteria grandinella TaxID=5974 RepID=A0A8J8NWH1_HALGN|nr:hypothetical protein FGO68_gene5195 [Halteria grandinella]
MRYRIEYLFGFQNYKNEQIGGLLIHGHLEAKRMYEIRFADNFTGINVDLKNLPSAEILTKEPVESADLPAYNASYYLGNYIREQYKKGDVLQQATLILMGLQEQRGLPKTGTIDLVWKRGRFQSALSDGTWPIKIIVEKCELVEGECNIQFNRAMYQWLEGRYNDQMIINYSKMRLME